MCEEQPFSITQFQDTLVSGICPELASPHATQTLFADIGRAVSLLGVWMQSHLVQSKWS